MKRALKILAIVVASIVLFAALTYIRVQSQMQRAIARHTEELDREIAEARRIPRALPGTGPLLQEDAWPRYVEAAQMFKDAAASEGFSSGFWIGRGSSEDAALFNSRYEACVEQLKAAQRCATAKILDPFEKDRLFAYEDNGLLIGVRMFASSLHVGGQDDAALDCLILVLGAMYDVGARSNLAWREGLRRIEREAILGGFKVILEGHSLTSADFGRHRERLDQVVAARPSIADVLRSEGITLRQSVLRHLSEGTAYGWEEEPSWRYLFSTRMKQVAALDRIKATSERWQSIRPLPPEKWTESVASNSMEEDLQGFGPASRAYRLAVNEELRALAELALLRAALAIAHFEAERGSPPTSLEELIPRFLKTVPVCPVTGTALQYRDRIAKFDSPWTKEWIIRPRPK